MFGVGHERKRGREGFVEGGSIYACHIASVTRYREIKASSYKANAISLELELELELSKSIVWRVKCGCGACDLGPAKCLCFCGDAEK